MRAIHWLLALSTAPHDKRSLSASPVCVPAIIVIRNQILNIGHDFTINIPNPLIHEFCWPLTDEGGLKEHPGEDKLLDRLQNLSAMGAAYDSSKSDPRAVCPEGTRKSQLKRMFISVPNVIYSSVFQDAQSRCMNSKTRSLRFGPMFEVIAFAICPTAVTGLPAVQNS